MVGVPAALFILWAGIWLGRRLLPRSAGPQVFKIFLAAVAVRALLVPVLHFTGISLSFAPDEASFSRIGSQMAMYWSGDLDYPFRARFSTERFFFYVNGVVFWCAGYVKFLPKFVNVIVGSLVSVYAYKIGRALFNQQIGIIAMALVAFFPSMVLWSSVNIRDPWAFLAVTAIVWHLVQLRYRVATRPIIAVFLWLFLLFNLRESTAVVAAASVIMTFVVVRREHVHRNVVVGLALCAALLLGFHYLGLTSRHLTASASEALETMEQIHQGLSQGSGAYGGAGEDISTASGALSWLPRGMAYFLFGPFPWQVRSGLQLSALPETLVWYFFLYQALVGMRFVVRHGRIEAWVVAIVAINLTLIYSLVEGNVGTAYRHRAQVLPLYLILSAVGVYLRLWPNRPRAPVRPAGTRLSSRNSD